MAKRGVSVKRAAAQLGVSADWIRRQIDSEAISPPRSGDRRKRRFALTDADIETLRTLSESDPTAGTSQMLARYAQLESERSSLLAQIAWERATAREQQKSLEAEQQRVERLTAEVEAQRARVEALKALSAWDRIRGRHKAV